MNEKNGTQMKPNMLVSRAYRSNQTRYTLCPLQRYSFVLTRGFVFRTSDVVR